MSSLPLPGRQRTEVWGDDSKMNEVLKVRQRLPLENPRDIMAPFSQPHFPGLWSQQSISV